MSTPSVRASGEITGGPRSARQVDGKRPRYERPAVHTSAIRCPGRSQAGRKGRVGIRPGEAPSARANRRVSHAQVAARGAPPGHGQPWSSVLHPHAVAPCMGLFRSRPCPQPALGRGSPVSWEKRPPCRSVTREARVLRSRQGWSGIR